MGFFRKFFRSNEPDEAPATVPSATPDQQPILPPVQTAESAEEQAPVSVDSPETAEEQAMRATQDKAQDATNAPWWTSSPASDALPLAVPDPPAQLEPHARGTAPLPEIADDAPLTTAAMHALSSNGSADEQEHRSDSPAPGGPKQNETRELNKNRVHETTYNGSGLVAAALRDVGRVRQINQDSVFALLTTLPREDTDMPLGLFVVADGMGGHDSGEVASRLAISSVARYVLAEIVLPALEDTPIEALQTVMVEAVKEANRTIWDHAQKIGSDMGTTCTAVLMLGAALYISHVGDSRAYLLQPSGLGLLTADHSAVGRLIQLGQLDPSEAREHPMRSQLYRTVGQQPQVHVDFVHQPIGAATHLLLGSDGLWGMIDEEQMTTVLQAYVWPQDACHKLVDLANLAGGEDNISAVVVSFPVAERASA